MNKQGLILLQIVLTTLHHVARKLSVLLHGFDFGVNALDVNFKTCLIGLRELKAVDVSNTLVKD